MTKTLTAVLLVAVAMLLIESVAAAKEHNFEKFAYKEGCASIVFDSRRSECSSRQKEKNVACTERRVSCDVNKAQKLASSYEELKKTLPKLNVADLPKAVEKLQKKKKKLDEAKALGKRGVPLAQQCVRNRSKVQSLFKRTIPLTSQAGKNAIEKHKKLLKQLRDAEKSQKEAKEKKAAAKRGDDSAKRKWEEASKRVREVESKLKRFNDNNGRNIRRNVDRLIDHYKAERIKHEKPTRNDQEHVTNCKKLSELRYSN